MNNDTIYYDYLKLNEEYLKFKRMEKEANNEKEECINLINKLKKDIVNNTALLDEEDEKRKNIKYKKADNIGFNIGFIISGGLIVFIIKYAILYFIEQLKSNNTVEAIACIIGYIIGLIPLAYIMFWVNAIIYGICSSVIKGFLKVEKVNRDKVEELESTLKKSEIDLQNIRIRCNKIEELQMEWQNKFISFLEGV